MRYFNLRGVTSMKRMFVCMLAVGTIAGATTPGWAQAPQANRSQAPQANTPASSNVTRANKLFQNGLTLLKQGLIGDACSKLAHALTLHDHPLIRYNLGICLRALSQYVEAHTHLTSAVKSGQLAPRLVAQAEQFIEELEANTATLEVVCHGPRAGITLGGEHVLVCPGQSEQRRLMPGAHQIVITSENAGSVVKTVHLQAGEHRRLTLQSPAPPPPLPAPTLVRRWDRRMPWYVFGGGALLAAASAPLYLQARTSAAEFQDEVAARCPSMCESGLPGSAHTLRERSRRWQAAAFTSATLGVGAMIVGAVLAVKNRPRLVRPGGAVASDRAFDVAPVITPDGVGAAARLSF